MTVSPYYQALHAPERTHEQRMQALKIGNDIRTQRARLKADIKAGRVNVLDIISEPPEWALSMKVTEVLRATPKLGKVKVPALMEWLDVSLSKTLGGVSDRQRDALIRALIWRLG